MPNRAQPPHQFQFSLRWLLVLVTLLSACLASKPLLGVYVAPASAIVLGIVLRVLASRAASASLSNFAMLLIVGGTIAVLVMGEAMGWLLWLLAAGVVAGLVNSQLNKSKQTGLLWTMAIAAERQVPLSDAMQAYAAECRGSIGRRIGKAARLLAAGHPLPDALGQDRKLLPAEAQAAVRLGIGTSTLPPSLRQAAEDQSNFDPTRNAAMGQLYYLMMVLLGVFGAAGFTVWKLLPAFGRLYQDLDAEDVISQNALPRLLFSFGPELELWFHGPTICLYLALFYACGWYAGWLPAPWRSRHANMAPILRSMATCARGGVPFDRAFAVLADWHPRASVRRRLDRVRQIVREQGADEFDALRRQGLFGAAEAAVLAAARRVGNLPWALEELAASARRRSLYRFQAWLRFLAPWVVLAVGVVVLLFAVACLWPLMLMLEQMANAI